jgi:hypothetical protein
MKVHFKLNAYNEKNEMIDHNVVPTAGAVSRIITKWKGWAPCKRITMTLIDERFRTIQIQYWLRKGTKWVHKYIDTKED